MERTLFGRKIIPHHLLTYGEQVYDILVAEIQKGRWKIDERLPGVINLAKELGFGTKTIQVAYDRLKEEGYVRTLGYRGTYLAAEHPKSRKAAGRVGLVVSLDQAEDPLILWYEHILFLAARRRNQDTEVVAMPAEDLPLAPTRLSDKFNSLVFLTAFEPGALPGPETGGLPAVFLCPPYERALPRVSADVLEASRELASAMIASGHRTILFSEDAIEPDPRLTALQYEGYAGAMDAAGFAVDDGFTRASRRVRNADAGSVVVHLREAVRRGAGVPAAVFAGSLGRAMAMTRVAAQAGIRIPEDLGIACIGSAPLDNDGTRHITGMLPDFNFMADTCLDLLDRQGRTGRCDATSVCVRMHLQPGHTLRTGPATASPRPAAAV